MNFGGHIAVVERAFAGESPKAGSAPGPSAVRAGRLLGAALPDLAAMGRFRLLGTTAHAAVADGVRLHHRTDDLFHSHPWFRSKNRTLSAALQEAGLARGPAMACSHVGIELLLDGRLAKEPGFGPATKDAFDAIAPARSHLEALVVDEQRARWIAHLDELASASPPDDNDDPEAVAARLHRILRRRPRLAFTATQIDTVAELLAVHQAPIDETGAELVEDLAATLNAATLNALTDASVEAAPRSRQGST